MNLHKALLTEVACLVLLFLFLNTILKSIQIPKRDTLLHKASIQGLLTSFIYCTGVVFHVQRVNGMLVCGVFSSFGSYHRVIKHSIYRLFC